MTSITIKGKEYKIYFSYNRFCDSDLLDRAAEILDLVKGGTGETKSESENVAVIKKMFLVTRDLMFEGFKKYNPVQSISEIGDLMDDYFDEGTENDPHGISEIFNIVAGELVAEGFFGQFLKTSVKALEKQMQKKKLTKKN